MLFRSKIHAVADEYIEIADLLRPLKITTVIDHMGHFYFKDGMNQPVIPLLLELLKKENFWIMLSNADRRSALGAPYDDALPFAKKFIEAAPDRCIWGTDWPHTHYTGVMPNDADLLELFYRFAPDAAMRASSSRSAPSCTSRNFASINCRADGAARPPAGTAGLERR